MNRQNKESIIDSVINDFENSQAAFLVKVQGLSVAAVQILKKGLHAKGGSIKVAKNTLLKLAALKTDKAAKLVPYFKEQVAVVFSDKEAIDVAKVLYDIAKKHENLVIVAGSLDGRTLSKSQVEFLATLPPKEVIVAQLCGTLKAPIINCVSVLKQVMTGLVHVIKQIEDQKKI